MVKVISYLSITPLAIINWAMLALTEATGSLHSSRHRSQHGDKGGVHSQVMHRGQWRPVPPICTGVAKLSFVCEDYVYKVSSLVSVQLCDATVAPQSSFILNAKDLQ